MKVGERKGEIDRGGERKVEKKGGGGVTRKTGKG